MVSICLSQVHVAKIPDPRAIDQVVHSVMNTIDVSLLGWLNFQGTSLLLIHFPASPLARTPRLAFIFEALA